MVSVCLWSALDEKGVVLLQRTEYVKVILYWENLCVSMYVLNVSGF